MELNGMRILQGWLFMPGILFVGLITNNQAIADLPPLNQKGISIASGYGAAHIVPFRIGFQKTLNRDWHPKNAWPITGYVEGSLYDLKGQKGPKAGSHRQLCAAALALVFRFNREKPIASDLYPYIEIGVGGSWLTRQEIGGRELGMHFQFEDRLGIGCRFGEKKQYDLGYKAVHFSNAYLGNSNHGINLHLMTLGYWF